MKPDIDDEMEDVLREARNRKRRLARWTRRQGVVSMSNRGYYVIEIDGWRTVGCYMDDGIFKVCGSNHAYSIEYYKIHVRSRISLS